MEDNIRGLLSQRSQDMLGEFSQVPGADTPWPNPIEPFDLLSPSTEKENAMASLIATAMLKSPKERGNILSLAQEHWGKLLDPKSIIPDSHFPISQVNVPEVLNGIRTYIRSYREESGEKEIKSALTLHALLEKNLSGFNYVNNYCSSDRGAKPLCFVWFSIVVRNPESFLSKWLREMGYEAWLPLEDDSPLEIFLPTVQEWNGHINTWSGDGEPPRAVSAIYNRRSISPLNLMELHLLTEEYNEEWATAVF